MSTNFDNYYDKTAMMSLKALRNTPYFIFDERWIEHFFRDRYCADCPEVHVMSNDGLKDCNSWIYDDDCHYAWKMRQVLRLMYAFQELVKDEF